MTFKNILAASKSESILAVIEGLPVDASGFYLSMEQMTAIEEKLEADAAVVLENISVAASLSEQVTAAVAAQATAEATAATANETIAARDARINELQAEIATGPAAEAEATTRDADEQGKDKTPYHLSNENPMNAAADSLMPSYKKK